MTDPPLFEEVSEQAASGSIAEAYADIRRVLGVPMVVFVYRALAVSPGRLEHVWGALGANLACAETQRNAASLDPPEQGKVAPLPRATMVGAGIDPLRLAGTLDSFDRANRLNLIGLEALLTGAPGDPTTDRGEARSAAPREMLPMADLASLQPGTRALLRRMSVPIAGRERPMLIPSLFRYFAHSDRLLEAIWQSIGPPIEDGRFHDSVAVVAQRARQLIGRLPYPVARAEDNDTREIISRFATTIPGMIVATKLLRLALGEYLAPVAERHRS